jgi:hypothetical protein
MINVSMTDNLLGLYEEPSFASYAKDPDAPNMEIDIRDFM